MSTPPYYTGGVPIGFEVGQRTSTFAADWSDQDVSTIVSRDTLTMTQMRQREDLDCDAIGFIGLPVWSCGSSRSFQRDSDQELPYPDKSFLHTLRNLIDDQPIATLTFAARLSSDPAYSISTGYGIPSPRQAYYLKTEVPTQALYLTDGRLVRPATSLWDFITAQDPLYMQVETTGLIFRNLEYRTVSTLPSVTNVQLVSKIIPSGIPDEPVVAVWNGSRSLDQYTYIPPAVTVAPMAPQLDMAAGFTGTNEDVAAFLQPDASKAMYPAPFTGTVPTTDVAPWPAFKLPFDLPNPFTPNSSNDYYVVPGAPQQAYELLVGSSTGSVLGSAYSIKMQNAWDSVGQIFRLIRRDDENDFEYSGRIQRLWLAATISRTHGEFAGSRPTLEKSISAALGRFLIVPSWDGVSTGNLPSRTTSVTTLDIPDITNDVFLGTDKATLLGLSSTTYRASQDLSGFRNSGVSIGTTPLIEGQDYVGSTEDPSILYFATAVSTGSVITDLVRGRDFARVTSPLDNTSLMSPSTLGQETQAALNRRYVECSGIFSSITRCAVQPEFALTIYGEPLRVTGDNSWTGPLAVAYGPSIHSARHVMGRLILQPGRALPTPLGFQAGGPITPSSWLSPKISPGASIIGIPFDLEAY